MRLPILTLAVLGALVSLGSGCAKPEAKFSRGMRNLGEVTRMGELSRSIEQESLFGSPERGYTTGMARGLTRTIARVGIGAYEIITFPFPPYGPVCTNYLGDDVVVYPDSYRPGFMSGSIMDTDTSLGFSGGDIFPMVPGNRFRIFDN